MTLFPGVHHPAALTCRRGLVVSLAMWSTLALRLQARSPRLPSLLRGACTRSGHQRACTPHPTSALKSPPAHAQPPQHTRCNAKAERWNAILWHSIPVLPRAFSQATALRVGGVPRAQIPPTGAAPQREGTMHRTRACGAAAAVTAAARCRSAAVGPNRSQVTLFVRLKDLRLTGRARQRLIRIAGPDRIAHG